MEKQELADLSVSLWERLRRAIREGDKAGALSLLEKAQQNNKKLKETVLDLTDMALSELASRAGEDAVCDLMRKFTLQNIRPLFGEDWLRLSIDERIRRRARGFAELHNIGVNIEEDDEKFILKFECDTGGYLAAKKGSGKTRQAHTWCGSEAGVAYYCTHCPVSFELTAIEDYGWPWWVTMPPKRAGDKCVQYHYKDPRAVPEHYYRRIGMKKTAASG